MLSTLFSHPLSFLFYVVGLIIAISIHEFSHALVADRLGDPTPRLQGRLTLNPLAHLDPVGTILLFVASFGWGKPVQFDPFNLRHPRRDAALISIAGPISNILLAITLSFILKILVSFGGVSLFTTILLFALPPIIVLNVSLAIFNLLPIHPLDGFKVVGGLLPQEHYRSWMELERYGMIFLLILIFPLFGSSPISAVIQPVISFIVNLLLPVRILGGVI